MSTQAAEPTFDYIRKRTITREILKPLWDGSIFVQIKTALTSKDAPIQRQTLNPKPKKPIISALGHNLLTDLPCDFQANQYIMDTLTSAYAPGTPADENGNGAKLPGYVGLAFEIIGPGNKISQVYKIHEIEVRGPNEGAKNEGAKMKPPK